MTDTDRYYNQLQSILSYWSTIVYDTKRDRFYGRVDENNVPDETAPLGSVMYARTLWAFSAGYQATNNPGHLLMAGKAYRCLTTVFWDKTYGGIYWLVDISGQPLADKKQIYALAFAIYGLTEYYKINPDDSIIDQAKELYWLIERYSYDPVNDGYFEAFNRDWSTADDLRLSDKDNNEQKTMNTHLHIMEAYVNLYRVWPDAALARRILKLVNLFHDRIVDAKTKHLVLFFNDVWDKRSDMISYGHDIEASWLLCEAAEILGDETLIARTKQLAIAMVDAILPGFDNGLNYEVDGGHLIAEKHWWVQAEATVGLLNAWQISGKDFYLDIFKHNYEYIERYIIDHVNGEWYWGIEGQHTIMQGQDKAGIWKCPYHNSRCLLEIRRRLYDKDLPKP
jgi:mannobiose 2-epimerase